MDQSHSFLRRYEVAPIIGYESRELAKFWYSCYLHTLEPLTVIKKKLGPMYYMSDVLRSFSNYHNYHHKTARSSKPSLLLDRQVYSLSDQNNEQSAK
jgi:hypothetical protein